MKSCAATNGEVPQPVGGIPREFTRENYTCCLRPAPVPSSELDRHQASRIKRHTLGHTRSIRMRPPRRVHVIISAALLVVSVPKAWGIEHCNGRRDRLCPSRIVRGIFNRDLWLAIVPQPVRDRQLREVYGKSLDTLETEWRISIQGK